MPARFRVGYSYSSQGYVVGIGNWYSKGLHNCPSRLSSFVGYSGSDYAILAWTMTFFTIIASIK